jgi:hypothetical protein
MLKVGFHRASLDRYTGFKSAPETEGALFYGEKPADPKLKETIEAQAQNLTESKPGGQACEPRST